MLDVRCCWSCRAVIDPTQLRLALAKHTRFKCQEMNDANELLDTIYECFAHSQVRLVLWEAWAVMHIA
jgi:hypothetical protein